MRWVSHVARMEAGRKVFTILTGKPTGKKPLERPVVDGRTLLERTLKKLVSIRGIWMIRLRIGINGEPL